MTDWKYSESTPAEVETRNHLGMKVRTVNYNVEENPDSVYEWDKYRYLSVTLPPSVWEYGAIVDALVTAHYPTDVMQAIVNNYLDDPTDKEHLAHMKEMQDWRKKAKAIAAKVTQTKE